MSDPIRTLPYVDTSDTIEHMKEIVLGERGEQSWVLRELLEDVVRFIAPKDQLSQIAAIYNWFLQHYTYVYDPIEVEQIKDPERLATEIRDKGRAVGDCDDASVFLVAAYRSLGIAANFARVGFDTVNDMTHVFVVAQDQYGRVIAVDPVANSQTKRMLGDIKQVKI